MRKKIDKSEIFKGKFESKIPFYHLVQLFEKISISSGHATKKKWLGKFFELWKTDEYFSLMRLILPQLDKDRSKYGMKESKLAVYYIEILHISKTCDDAIKIIKWRRPDKNMSDIAGDFGSTLESILINRCQYSKQGVFSIGEINELLDQLHLSSDIKEKMKILQKIIMNCSPIEQKWLVRIILKDLKIGLSEKTIFDFFHEDANLLFNLTCNLKEICDKLKDPSKRMEGMSVSLFQCFKPMLAERDAPEKVIELMEGNPFVVEVKYDGK